jgi:aminopeptidase-like protein
MTTSIKVNPVEVSRGMELYALVSRMFPYCRSITGNGVRETLNILKDIIPLEIHEVPTGTKVFDWTIPKEWNIRDAYIRASSGRKVIDFKDSNLHVLNYSIPVHKRMSLAELKPHLYSLPGHPDWIPYRTTYYDETWGFCVTHNQLNAMMEDEYEVVIDATLEPGHLTYGEYYIQGELDDEVLISAHVCHPSLANDNLSGISIAAALASTLRQTKPRYSYRFLFIPGTIGSIAWLALNEERVSRIKHGFVASLLGEDGPFTYKRSRRGTTEIDQIVEWVLKSKSSNNNVIEFSPYGYDERQYCSPGFDLAVGCLSRTPFGQFPQYHTSADNLDFVQPDALEESYDICLSIMRTLEANRTYINTNPNCEPQLGRRGLYSRMGGDNDSKAHQMALLWVLNLSDGKHSLLDISRRANVPFDSIERAATRLLQSGLLLEALGDAN